MSSNLSLSSIPPSFRPFVIVPLLTLAFYIIPATIHQAVQSVDTLYDVLDRRARSPYEASISATSIFAAGGIMLVWHVCLAMLGYNAVGKEYGEGKGVSRKWDRILGRIIIPFVLLVLGVQFGWEVVGKFIAPRDVVMGNIV